MFSDNSLGAYLHLQERALNQTDAYALERIDRALDEVTNNPLRDEPAPFQARSAMANAAKVLKARRSIAPSTSLDAMRESGHDVHDASCGSAALEAIDTVVWLTYSRGLTQTQRSILVALAQGEDAASLAERHDVPLARMRERIARARAAGRRAYCSEVLPPSATTFASARSVRRAVPA